MKIKVISWNVRGVNAPEKRKVIKNFLRNYRADIICLQETKVQEMSVKLARGLGAGRRWNWKTLNAEGSAGGHPFALGQQSHQFSGFRSWKFLCYVLVQNA